MTTRSDNPLSERYAKQRLMRILMDMVAGDQLLSWSSLAADITVFRGVEFSRENLRRLRKGTLGPANVEIIIKYIEEKHDPNIRERLRPDAIFDEMAQSARDYYFHIPERNDLEEWNEQILDRFSGVYFCLKPAEVNSYLPARHLKSKIHDEIRKSSSAGGQSMLLNKLVHSRSILILQKTGFGYFYASELPLSSLLPSGLRTICQRVYYEGIAVISANTIQVQLRDCLTRVPRTHSITVNEKDQRAYENPNGLAFQILNGREKVQENWAALSADEVSDLHREFNLAIASDYYLQGPATHSIVPLPSAETKVVMTVSDTLAYLEKPSNFLEELADHFFLDDVTDVDTIRKIVENPLVIGTLDEH